MSLINMLLGEASHMEAVIKQWKKPEGHQTHTATLEIGGYVGSGEHSIYYKCSCGSEFHLGSADPDLIDDEVFNDNHTK